MKQRIAGRIAAFLTAVTAAAMTVPAFPARAENFLFISEVKLAAGEGAADSLEEAGYRVMAVGLNDSVSAEKQVYLGYKLNTGSPITNLLIAPDSGDTLTQNGVTYTCADHVDVDAGIGSAGCVYYTKDANAGKPLVGLNVLKANVSDGEQLLPIPNDGAEVVRRPDGAPADIEPKSETVLMYLAQIHDGTVCPYVSEVVPVTDTDRWNAVYTAAQFGYNYFIDGDIDSAPDTYTLLAYKRTADPDEAVTGITAVAADTVQALESNAAEGLSGNAIGISGVEYVRASAQAVPDAAPYYLYFTKEKEAGNPISMLYANAEDNAGETLFGSWVSGFFGSKGAARAYTYTVNEDLLNALQNDMTVCVRLPVQLLRTAGAAVTETTAPTETTETTTETEPETTAVPETTSAPEETETTSAEETTAEAETTAETTEISDTAEAETTVSETETVLTEETEAVPETTVTEQTDSHATAASGTPESIRTSDEVQYVPIAYQTFRDGLPEEQTILNGLRQSQNNAPVLDHTGRSQRDSKYQASAFSKGWYILVLGGVAVIGALIAAVFITRKAGKPQPAKAAPPAKPAPEKPKQNPKNSTPEKKKPVQNTGKKQSGRKKKSGKKKK